MAYEQKDNSGSLFKNDKKSTDKHPDRKGTAKIDGTEYWVSGWVKQDKNGNPWMSLSFQRKEQAARPLSASGAGQNSTRGTASATAPRHSDDISDEIPF